MFSWRSHAEVIFSELPRRKGKFAFIVKADEPTSSDPVDGIALLVAASSDYAI